MSNLQGAEPIKDTRGRPLRDLRISLTDQCNFRCSYCMPKDLYGEGQPFLHQSTYLSFDEIERIARAAVQLGVRKIKLTGGEPLMRPGVAGLIEKLNAIEGIEDLGLITNGFYLKSQAEALKRAGLQRITISLDSLNHHTFAQITGRSESLERVLEGIDWVIELGFAPIKVNMVVQRGVNDGEVLAMAQYFRGSGVELRFIEYMDVGHRHRHQPDLVVSNDELHRLIDARYPLVASSDGYYGEVAQTYRYADGQGKLGFISSMSKPFCGSCTRLRLGADGKAYRCLFSGTHLNLRALLRVQQFDDQHLGQEMAQFWNLRDDRYSELRAQGRAGEAKSNREPALEMYRIGG